MENNDILLSSLQKKEIESQKAKELEERRKLFIGEIEAIQKKYKLSVRATLNVTPGGILPNLVIIQDNETNPS